MLFEKWLKKEIFSRRRLWPAALLIGFLLFLVAAPRSAYSVDKSSSKGKVLEPWTSAQIITPEVLVKELKSKNAPVVIQVGVWNLYRRSHIPGALYAGPASEQGGLERLRSEMKSLSRNRAVVIYCGCCPLNYCPNIRPAFKLARELGFSKLQVLLLPHDFGQDWIQKGFPVEKSAD